MKIIISRTNIKLLNTLYIENEGYEVGGILLGKRSKDDFIVTNIVFNFSRESLKRNKYIRNILNLTEIISELIKDSNYEIDYIGEWHTHPNMSTKFSSIDKKAMVELNEDFPELILLIKGKNIISGYLFATNNNSELEINIKEGI